MKQTMTTRTKNFNALESHPVFKSAYKKLRAAEREACVCFINDNDMLTEEEFNVKVSRWMLDDINKPKNHTTMWALVMASNGR